MFHVLFFHLFVGGGSKNKGDKGEMNAYETL